MKPYEQSAAVLPLQDRGHSEFYCERGLVEQYLEAVASPVERVTATSYDDVGRQIQVRDVGGGVTQFAYNGDGPSATVITTDAKNYNSRDYYDLDGERIRTVDNLGLTTTQAYNSRGWATTMTDARGNNWVTGYDFSGNVTTSTDPLGHVTTTGYDELGRVSTVKDARGNVTTTSYWADGRVMDVTDPRRYTTHTTYDLANKYIAIQNAVKDAQGNVIFQQTTTQTLDAVGNVVNVTDPLMHVTTYTYDGVNQLQSVTDALTHTTTYSRDAMGRVTTVTDALVHNSRQTYDALGRASVSTDAAGVSEQTLWNPLNLVGAVIDGLRNITTNGYDLLGEQIVSEDADSAVSKKQYDADGRLIEFKDAGGSVTSWKYDENGNKISQTDPLGQSNPTGHVTTWQYDIANRMTDQTDRLGRQKHLDYFPNNLLQTETDRASGTVVNTKQYDYDPINQIASAAQDNGTGTYSTITYTYTFDTNGRHNAQTDVWNFTLTYSYDLGDRLTKVEDSNSATVNLYTNGITTIGYDNANRLTSRSFTAGTRQLSVGYVYNNANQLTEADRYSDAAGTTLVGKTIYDWQASVDHVPERRRRHDRFLYIQLLPQCVGAPRNQHARPGQELRLRPRWSNPLRREPDHLQLRRRRQPLRSERLSYRPGQPAQNRRYVELWL